MSKQSWNLIPKHGVERDGIQVYFGAARAAIRAALLAQFGVPKSYRENEDDFNAHDGSFLRLRYVGDKIRDIEFLGGSLMLDNLELHKRARGRKLTTDLAKKGYGSRYAAWIGSGLDFESLGINIATHEDVGGDEGDDQIEWVIMSSGWTQNVK